MKVSILDSRTKVRMYLVAFSSPLRFLFFFFQAEDGIRDRNVTGVQTCALPIWLGRYLGACRARGTRRRRRRARGLALHARLRPPSHLLPRGRHDGDRRGSVVQHLVLEAAPRSGARRRTSADHLGNPAVYAGSVAPRRRQRGRRLALPRRVSAHAGAEALTPWHPTPDP